MPIGPVEGLSDADKVRVRYHLNYQNIAPGSPLWAGLVIGVEDQYMIERSMEHILVEAIPKVMELLNNLDAVETQMAGAPDRFRALKADVVTLNQNEFAQLIEAYTFWQRRLALILGVKVNPRPPADDSGVGALNVRVVKGP